MRGHTTAWDSPPRDESLENPRTPPPVAATRLPPTANSWPQPRTATVRPFSFPHKARYVSCFYALYTCSLVRVRPFILHLFPFLSFLFLFSPLNRELAHSHARQLVRSVEVVWTPATLRQALGVQDGRLLPHFLGEPCVSGGEELNPLRSQSGPHC